jgi:hypothetical protein
MRKHSEDSESVLLPRVPYVFMCPLSSTPPSSQLDLVVLFEFTIKANKSSQFENGIKGLVGQLRAPIPGTRHATINARSGIIKVVGTTAIKSGAEKVVQNVLSQLVHSTKAVIYHAINAIILFANLFQILQAADNWSQNTRN